jgi:hypothetical protein
VTSAAPGTPRERGSMTAELAILAPVVALFALMSLGLGRYVSARQEVADAARAAAQAASVVASPSQAQGAAATTVTDEVSNQSRMCVNPVVAADTSNFTAGGEVRVSVTCTVDLSDLLVPGVPGSVRVTSTQVAPIDPYRSVG